MEDIMGLKEQMIENKKHQIKIVEKFIEMAKSRIPIDLTHIDKLENQFIKFLYELDELMVIFI